MVKKTENGKNIIQMVFQNFLVIIQMGKNGMQKENFEVKNIP